MNPTNTASNRTIRLTRAATLVLAAGAACAAPAAARPDIRPVALTGSSAGKNLVYDRFDTPAINGHGRVVFWARIAETIAGNDDCEGALELREGETFVTTAGATDSSNPGGCAPLRDTWYKYTATESGQVTVIAGASDFAGHATIYRGVCGDFTEQTCNGFAMYQLNAGESVYVQLGSSELPEVGTFTIRIRLGDLSTPAPTRRPADEAIFSDRNGALALVLRRGDATDFDPSLFHTGVQFPALDDGGTIALAGGVAGSEPVPWSASPTIAAFANGPEGMSVLLEAEMPSTMPSWHLPPPRLSATGMVAYSRLDGTALRYADNLIDAGSQAPGMPPGVTLRHLDQPMIGAGDAVAFRSRLAGAGVTEANDAALFIDRDGPAGAPIEPLVRTGDLAPGTPPPAHFASLAIEPAVNAAAGATFWASLSGVGVDANNDSGLWTTRGSDTGSLALLARTGEAAPGVGDGAVLRTLSRRPAMNAPGDVSFSAFIVGPSVGIDTNSGIWVYPITGDARLLVREGDAVASLPKGVVYAGFSEPVMNDRGDIAFVAKFRGDGVVASNSTALLLARRATADGSIIELVARTGDVLHIGDKDARTISEIDLATAAPGAGRATLNADGDVVFQLYFTDQSSGVFITTGACTADINTDGTVNSQDFFDFLTLFFAGDPRADVNRSGAVDSQDFFDFLGAFFGGC